MKISANLKLHWTEVIYQRVNLESYKLQIIEKWNLLITQIVAYLKLYSNLNQTKGNCQFTVCYDEHTI
jgi:hypothetical protein